MAGEHGCWWKSNYYEGSVSVPLIASLPGVVPENTHSNILCNLMDLGPSLLDMAGANPMPAVSGRSLWPVLTGGNDPERPDETFSEHLGAIDAVPSRMVRSGPWKLYKYHDTTPPVLYNLDDDSNEENDLGSHPAYDAVRTELLNRLYRDWDPEYILRQSLVQDRDMRLLNTWGKKVQPPHEDSLPIPEGAEDVELL